MKTNTIIQGDCIEQIKLLQENSVDAIITDPPYGIGFMGKEWDNFKPKEIKKTTKLIYKTDYVDGVPIKRKKPELVTRDSGARVSGTYDLSLKGKLGFQEWFKQVAVECLRVLKPGGFLLSFGGTRTSHRLVCGIEDAGFEIRDTIMWIYGSGFPKSRNIGQDFDRQECRKQLEKKLGRKPTREEFKKSWESFRKVVGEIKRGDVQKAKEKGVGYLSDPANRNNENQFGYGIEKITTPQTKEAKEWEGWGTALKPACEPIVVARKPLSEKNVALNVLKWGTGGINIDACRISLEGEKQPIGSAKRVFKSNQYTNKKIYGDNKITPEQGRFPANIILDEEAGRMLDEQSGQTSQGHFNSKVKMVGHTLYEGGFKDFEQQDRVLKDKGGASRFFYCAKASKSERNFGCEDLDETKQDESRKEGNPGGDNPRNRGVHLRKNNHPTVKPIKLMEYLIKLVSKEGATILDPFIGSGTTAIACIKLNRKFIGIEKEKDYVKIANARIKPFLKQKKLK